MTTGGPSSVPPTSVPGQIKIAKRPVTEESRPPQQGKKVPLPDAGKRGEVSIQVKPPGGGQGQPGGGQAGKGKRGGDAKAPGGQKPNVKTDGKTPVNKAKDGPKPSQQTEGEAPAQRQRPPRVPAIAGARNLLSAALKSSTRDAQRPKAAEGDVAKAGRPVQGKAAAGPPGNAAGGDAASGAQEKAKRPPRNRNRKPAGGAGGDQSKTDQAGASNARIDA